MWSCYRCIMLIHQKMQLADYAGLIGLFLPSALAVNPNRCYYLATGIAFGLVNHYFAGLVGASVHTSDTRGTGEGL